MKTEKSGNNWKAYYDAESGRYFARIMYISREGLEEYRYEINEAMKEAVRKQEKK